MASGTAKIKRLFYTTTENKIERAAYQLDVQSIYREEIKKFPLLSPQEVTALARRIQAGKDAKNFKSLQGVDEEIVRRLNLDHLISEGQEARNKLVEGSLGIVRSIAFLFVGRTLSLEDCIQEGNRGLVDAAEAFNPDMDVLFATYANYHIKKRIREARGEYWAIRTPLHTVKMILKYRMLSSQCPNKTPEEIFREMGLTERRRAPLEQFLRVGVETLTSTQQELVGRKEPTYSDSPPPQEVMENLLWKLSPKEREVLELYYGLNGKEPETHKGIADRLGFTRQRIGQIVAGALKKLKEELEKEEVWGAECLA